MDKCKQFKNPFRRPSMVISGAASSIDSFLPTKETLKGLLAGGVTGGLEICISFPLDYIKTQLQLDERSAQPRYTGFFDVVKKTVNSHGIPGLYRGLTVLVLGSIPKTGARFGTYEYVKTFFLDNRGKISQQGSALAGLIAGTVEAILVVTPMETVKVKFIHDQISANPKFTGFFNGIQRIVKDQGIRGCYQGTFPTILKQGTSSALRFYLMETLKDWYQEGDPDKPVKKRVTCIFGVCTGIFSCYCNTPLDVIKTRMQSLEAYKYKNAFDCCYKIAKHEGFFAFYKGTVPRCFRAACEVSITFTLYDTIKEAMDEVW